MRAEIISDQEKMNAGKEELRATLKVPPETDEGQNKGHNT
jgi:hypothetical protein